MLFGWANTFWPKLLKNWEILQKRQKIIYFCFLSFFKPIQSPNTGSRIVLSVCTRTGRGRHSIFDENQQNKTSRFGRGKACFPHFCSNSNFGLFRPILNRWKFTTKRIPMLCDICVVLPLCWQILPYLHFNTKRIWPLFTHIWPFFNSTVFRIGLQMDDGQFIVEKSFNFLICLCLVRSADPFYKQPNCDEIWVDRVNQKHKAKCSMQMREPIAADIVGVVNLGILISSLFPH